jgi:hypothetical protein
MRWVMGLVMQHGGDWIWIRAVRDKHWNRGGGRHVSGGGDGG